MLLWLNANMKEHMGYQVHISQVAWIAYIWSDGSIHLIWGKAI